MQHVFPGAPWFFAGWDPALAEGLIADFRIPTGR